MKTLEAKPFDQNAENLKARKSTVYIDRARGRRLGAKSNRYARTQKSVNSLICFHCSNSCFLLENWHCWSRKAFTRQMTPQSREKKLQKRPFFDSADRHEKLYGRSRLYASAQGRHKTGGILSLFSSLSFDISIKNSMQRWSSEFQGLFCVKIRKMAQGSNDLSTLPLMVCICVVCDRFLCRQFFISDGCVDYVYTVVDFLFATPPPALFFCSLGGTHKKRKSKRHR